MSEVEKKCNLWEKVNLRWEKINQISSQPAHCTLPGWPSKGHSPTQRSGSLRGNGGGRVARFMYRGPGPPGPGEPELLLLGKIASTSATSSWKVSPRFRSSWLRPERNQLRVSESRLGRDLSTPRTGRPSDTVGRCDLSGEVSARRFHGPAAGLPRRPARRAA